MFRSGVSLILMLSCAFYVYGADVTTSKPSIIPVPSPKPTPTPTLTPSDPTTPSTETTTVLPDTTTLPTTTPPVPDTTTTQAPPAPTPKPGPLPAPEQGKWMWVENNVTCIILQFAMQINVTYSKSENNSTSYAHTLLNVPKDAKEIAGSCGDETQWIMLSWPNTTWANNVTVEFIRNETTHQYAMARLNVSLTPDPVIFPNISSNATISLSHSSPEWVTALGNSYKCMPATKLNSTAEAVDAVATLTVTQLQEEAFRKTSTTGFSLAQECNGGNLPDAVPIAVGCALGALVLIVLGAYLVGRHRSAARGYLSM